MFKQWSRWNDKAKFWLWIVVLIAVAASLPLGMLRMNMEKSADTVEIVFDYRDIVEVAEFQPRPMQFLDERLESLREAGVTTLAVYESSLRELQQAGRLVYYTEKEAALLQGRIPDDRTNFTYILFNSERDKEAVGPIVRAAFDRMEVPYREWAYESRTGLIVEEPLQSAQQKVMDFDPLTLQELRDAGFHILARFSDRVKPYNGRRVEEQVAQLSEYGVTRILFDGDRVKGAADQAELESLDHFAALLNRYDIGIAAIENLKVPQAGINKIAYMTNYNVTRLYSLSPEDAMTMTLEGISDRFVLAAKDRNIRMFFVNSLIQANPEANGLIHTVNKLTHFMVGEEGIIAALEKAGFPVGISEPFTYEKPAWEKPLRGVVAIGAVAMIALLIAAFVPGVLIPVFAIGIVGSAGLYVLNSSLMEQALALGAAVSGPTLALIWVMNRIYARTTGDRRMVGGEAWTVGGKEQPETERTGRMQWMFASPSFGRRVGYALNWFIVATLITLSSVPLVFGLLNNITYSLVLEQFRGVSGLHLGPIFLVAVYIFLYDGNGARGVPGRAKALLKQPVTVLSLVAVAVLGAVGYYYMTRTGNFGQVSSIELLIRGWLESTFGVRPRFKEFMLGHPPLLLGLFLALRYRAAWALIIAGAIGQLTMVSTFTHIHTPLYISNVRTLLGLGTGIVIGLIGIAVWAAVEGAWRKWALPVIRKLSES